MARKLSVDLELNAQGYTQGINDAKSATAQYTNATKDLKKETEEYLTQFGSLRKQLGTAKKDAFNLAAAFSQLSKTEKESEIGQQMAEDLQIAIEKAAELQDVMSDTSNAIKNAASDTAGLDAFKESMEVGKDLATAYAGAIAKLTGDEKALKDAVASIAMIQGGFNAVIKTTNMLQKNSSTMIALQRAGVLSLAQAETISTAATKAATVATKALGAAMRMVPYLALAAGIAAIVTAVVKYTSKSDKATEVTEKLNKEMHDASIQGQKDAQSDITKINLLYGATQNLNLRMEDRIKAVKDLQKQYPSYFGDLTQEQILTGQASAAYRQLKDDILACAQARAYEKKISDIAEQNVDLDDQIKKQKEVVKNAKRIAEEAKNAQNGQTYGTAGVNMSAMGASHAADVAKKEQKALEELEAQKAANIKQQKEYVDSINQTIPAQNRVKENAENANKHGGGGSSTTSTSKPKVVENVLPPVNKIDKQIKDWFKDFDKKIAAETKALSEKNKADAGAAMNILNSPQNIQAAQNAIQQALQPDVEFDFSAFPESLQKAAEDAVKSMDRISEAMAEAGKQRDKFLAAGDMAGVAEMDKQLEELTDKYNEQNEAIEKYAERAEKVKNLSSAFEAVGTEVGQLGSLFSALGQLTDDAGLKVMGIIAETLATMALSFSKALMTCTTWWEWIAFGITGMIQLVSMVSQIKQLTAGGYAEGGIVPGNSFNGDRVMAMVNSGEMILNTHQQKNLFDMLNGITGAGISSSRVEVTGVIKGKDLLLVQKNYNSIGSKSGQSIKF